MCESRTDNLGVSDIAAIVQKSMSPIQREIAAPKADYLTAKSQADLIASEIQKVESSLSDQQKSLRAAMYMENIAPIPLGWWWWGGGIKIKLISI